MGVSGAYAGQIRGRTRWVKMYFFRSSVNVKDAEIQKLRTMEKQLGCLLEYLWHKRRDVISEADSRARSVRSAVSFVKALDDQISRNEDRRDMISHMVGIIYICTDLCICGHYVVLIRVWLIRGFCRLRVLIMSKCGHR